MAKQNLGISVVGLGKLGLCTAACFASKGFKVTGVDIDIDKINKINRGISPIEETGLSELLKKTRHNLHATQDYKQAVLNSDVTFIVVATPSLADGSFSNEYLERSLIEIGQALKAKKAYHLIVVTSTVMPQTVQNVASFILERESGKKCGKDFGVSYNPEFIALGSVIHDFLNPDMILIGEMSKRDGDMLQGIYELACDSKPAFARMSPVNAEITKITLNCYITTKITFANSLSAICEKINGADSHVISRALGFDSRIGSKYLKPGLGFGGPCFPRDNVAFAAFARLTGNKAKLAEMVDEVNREQPLRVENKIKDLLILAKKDKKNARIAFLGLSYKPNTPVVEDSQALNIVQLLISEGYRLTVYDPQAMENARGVLGNAVTYAENGAECVKGADLCIIAVPWQDFKAINYLKINGKLIILDCWKLLEKKAGMKITFLGIGA
jgi:UDPglucose 6-dehydrogenase